MTLTVPSPGADKDIWAPIVNAALLELDDRTVSLDDRSTLLETAVAAAAVSRDVVVSVTDALYGAKGDATSVAGGAMTAGSAVLTVASGVFTAALATAGKVVIVPFAGPNATPLVTTILSRTSNTQITLADAASVTVSGQDVTWGTDDTTAVTAARDAWLTRLTIYAALGINTSNERIQPATLYFPPGSFIVRSAEALLTSPTTGTPQIIHGARIAGAGSARSQIIFASSQGTTTDNRLGNLMLAANRLRRAVIGGFQVRSTNANQTFAYLWCASSVVAGAGSEYGAGAQNDIVWSDLVLSGDWKRGWCFDGPSASANLNSEMEWWRCRTSNSATFAQAIVKVTGDTGGVNNDQRDQFLNYRFNFCLFEFRSGHVLDMPWGGHVHVRDGSWILGVAPGTASSSNKKGLWLVGTAYTGIATSSNPDIVIYNGESYMALQSHTGVQPDTDTTGRWLRLGGTGFRANNSGLTRSFNVTNLSFDGTRFEFRAYGCKIFDVDWRGTSRHISCRNVGVSNDYITYAGISTADKDALQRNMPVAVVRMGTSFSQPSVAFEDSELCGHFLIEMPVSAGTVTAGHRMAFKRSNFREYINAGTPTGVITVGTAVAVSGSAAGSAIRYTGATAPKVRVEDCAAVADILN